MDHSLILLSLLALTSGVHSQSGSECTVPPTAPTEACCKMPDCPFKLFGIDKVMKECFDEYKIDIKTVVPGGADNTSGCLDECLLTKAKLLTTDLTLNEAALKEIVSKSFTGSWADVGTKVLDVCLKIAAGKVAKDGKCKSGSDQFILCMSRGIFMNCPKDSWTESGDCKAQLERLEKCPNALPAFPKKDD